VASEHPLPTGPWVGSITIPAGRVGFELEIERLDQLYAAHIHNGEETVDIPRIEWDGERAQFFIDDFDAQIDAVLDSKGTRLDGRWGRRLGDDYVEWLPFHATIGAGPRLVLAEEHLSADTRIDGRWKIQFERSKMPSVGIFETLEDGAVRGAILNTTGDYRYLSGYCRDGRLMLSRFDGFHAFLFDAQLVADDRLEGKFGESSYGVRTWTATRDPEAQLPDSFAHFEISGDVNLAEIEVIDLDGNACTLDRFAHDARVLIIEILGTWCPNCHDASDFLVKVRHAFADRGLSVVGLSFEMTTDVGRNLRFLRRYSTKHAIDYPVALAFRDVTRSPADVFPTIKGQWAFPTIVMLSGSGEVLAVHTGFVGPAAGAEHTAMCAQLEERVQELLGDSGR
jgi:hypothetical protein